MSWRASDKKREAAQRKASWIVGLICGPVFAIIFCVVLYVPTLLFNLMLNPWLCLIASVAATAPLADRIGKRHNVMAQQFAGPMACCCMLALGLLLFLRYSLFV